MYGRAVLTFLGLIVVITVSKSYGGGDNLPNPPKPKSEFPVDSSLIVYAGGDNFPNPPNPKSEFSLDSSLLVYAGGNNLPNPPKPK